MAAKGNLSTEDLCFTPAVELREMLRKKAISPVELMQAFLERIDEKGILSFEGRRKET